MHVLDEVDLVGMAERRREGLPWTHSFSIPFLVRVFKQHKDLFNASACLLEAECNVCILPPSCGYSLFYGTPEDALNDVLAMPQKPYTIADPPPRDPSHLGATLLGSYLSSPLH